MYIRTIPAIKIIFAIILHALIFSFSAFAQDGEQRYQLALKQARAGKLQQSIQLFQQLTQQYPHTLRYQYDYIQILSWAEKDDEILTRAKLIDINQAPVYVLETVARAYRNKKYFNKAETLYQRATEKMPERLNAWLGLALTLGDMNKTAQAIAILQLQKQKHPQDKELLFALAYAYEKQGDWFSALTVYDRLLAVAPNSKRARRGHVFVLDKMGSATLANEEIDRYPHYFSAEEIAKIRWNRAAFLVRTGKISTPEGRPHFDKIDKAIKLIRQNLAFAETMPEKSARWWKTRARFDLIVALHDRYKMQDVVDNYHLLQQKQMKLPAYVQIAVADALLYLKQPKQAEYLYLAALNQTATGDDSEQIFYAKISLYFAMLEAEQHKKASHWLQKLSKNQPVRLGLRKNRGAPSRSKPNSRKLTVELLLAMDKAYNDDLQGAQQQLQSLLNKAPNNQSIRAALANVYYWRGWPRRAEKLYQLAATLEADDSEIQINHIQNLMELKQYPQVDKEISRLKKTRGYHQELQRQTRLWEIHNDWEFTFQVNGAESSGSQEGSSDTSFESYLYAPPIAYQYRPFLHYKWAQGLFPEGRGDVHREGVGLEYSLEDSLITAEIHHNQFARNRLGARLAIEYAFNDYLTVSASYDSLSAETPLRALSSEVEAESFNGGLVYRVSELQNFRFNAGFMAFSDNNDRYQVSAAYYQRWITSSCYKFATEIEIFHSGNSSDLGPYYSPTKDISFGVMLDNQYLTYRHYDFSLQQNLKINAGGYWQERFGTGWAGNIIYEHEWNAWNQVFLSYGVTGFSRLYNAARENGWEASLRLSWRF